jgi:hypothetical protein
MTKHIFIGIDLGDKNSVTRIAVDREKSERFTFVNNRQGRGRLFREAKRRSDEAGGAKIIMAYEASSWALVNKVVLESRFILNSQSGLETSR